MEGSVTTISAAYALEDDAVFNVVGEVLPAAHVERVLGLFLRFLDDLGFVAHRRQCSHSDPLIATERRTMDQRSNGRDARWSSAQSRGMGSMPKGDLSRRGQLDQSGAH